MTKLITVHEWAKARFVTPPGPYTRREWCRNGWFTPRATKIGRAWMVAEDAVLRSRDGDGAAGVAEARHRQNSGFPKGV